LVGSAEAWWREGREEANRQRIVIDTSKRTLADGALLAAGAEGEAEAEAKGEERCKAERRRILEVLWRRLEAVVLLQVYELSAEDDAIGSRAM
jgi:hypothetical protein